MKTNRIDAVLPDLVCLLIFLYVIGYFFSPFVTSITSILLVIAWLISKQYRYLPSIIKPQPFIVIGAVLSLCFMIAVNYSSATRELALSDMSKYRKFIYIPILMTFFREERYRKWAWAGFVVASFFTLFLSYLKMGGILNLNDKYVSPTIKNRITHSMYIAFFTYYCLFMASQPDKYRYIYLILILIGLHNLFFVVDGRTGQVMVLGLIVLYAYQHYSVKWLCFTLLLVSILIGGFLKFSNKAGRINLGIENTLGVLNDLPVDRKYTDLELRYALWDHSIELIEESPVIGHGTGSFKGQLNRVAKNHAELLGFDHPHNEFFKIGVELGAVGLILYVSFYVSMYLQLKRLVIENRYLAQGVLISLIFVSLFNSPIYDHAQGNWFVTLIALCFLPSNQLLKNGTVHV